MTIILFLIILAALVFVHELGHFIAAKKSGVRVDEFALGFPPRIWSKTVNGTRYALNLIPFGGYVSIFGEEVSDEAADPHRADSFVNKPKWVQAMILAAGVAFNIVFAWILLSVALWFGFPASASYEADVENPQLTVTGIIADSPAEMAGIEAGAVLRSLESPAGTLSGEFGPDDVRNFVSETGAEPVSITYSYRGTERTTSVTPAIVDGNPTPSMGIYMDRIGVVKKPIHEAIVSGAVMTADMTWSVAKGLVHFIWQAFTGQANFSAVSGPVGIAGLVGDASQFGVTYILAFTAFISVNLAVMNLLPFPALDGGRILFVLIEAIRKKPISAKVANGLNALGFLLLLILMVVVTVSDIIKLF